MEHNLEDSLNLESAMSSMDFDHSGVVVSQEDIALETTGHEADIPMEFEHIEEQSMLMDTGNEEIIVSDFMNDQYTLQEYSVQDEPAQETSGLIESNELIVMPSQNESIIDMQFDQDTSLSVAQEVTTQPKFISVKAAVAPQRKKNETIVAANPLRQVAIAPKPPKLVQTVPKGLAPGKQYAIAPKPVALVTNKNTSLVKKMSLASVLQAGSKSTHIGKQIVMMPAGGMQKIKLVTSSSGVPTVQYVRNANNDQAEIIKNVSSGNSQKPVMAKVFVQAGQQNSESWSQSAVITKLQSATNITPHTRYVMQQKTVPISLASNKVLLASPTKQAAVTSKKVVISSNPSQNMILKTTATPKTAQISKDGNLVVQAQPTQLHQINVPGKGIQYIRLITNPSSAPPKVVAKPQGATAVPSKGFVLTDGKGNVIQMAARKLVTGQPPPLVLTGSLGAVTKVTTKSQKKLVRIAPVAMKPSQQVTQQSTRSAQSLLAPLSPMGDANLEEVSELLESRSMHEEPDLTDDQGVERDEEISESKAALRALIADTVADESQDGMHSIHGMHGMHEVEVDYERQETPIDDDSVSNMDQHDSSNRSEEHSLIVIPSSFGKPQNQMRDDKNYSSRDELPYLSPKASQQSESDLVSGDHLGLRPRKACNCTKSQCLKLYCDCFANGEFCNGCNCNNCHNNLENEELRQKAIRACLDRNPNAFRPKIGKAKSGGPDIIRRHNKGCNCKRSGCLKNYCECYEAKIACTSMCKCVGCRNVEETLERRRDALRLRDKLQDPLFRPPPVGHLKQPCSFMTSEVIEAVCQCLLAAAAEAATPEPEPLRDVIEEFARCLQDIISASHQSTSLSVLDDSQA